MHLLGTAHEGIDEGARHPVEHRADDRLEGPAAERIAQLELDAAGAVAALGSGGLVAGATGTGKTVTLQGIVESLSVAGVPSFVADVKGDLSGMARAGEGSPKVAERVAALAAGAWVVLTASLLAALEQAATERTQGEARAARRRRRRAWRWAPASGLRSARPSRCFSGRSRWER